MSRELIPATIGMRIKGITLNDEALVLEMDNGYRVRMWDDGQSCCEHRYLHTDDDLKAHEGAVLMKAELADAPDQKDEHGNMHEIQFLRFTTSAGGFVVSAHNEHNGYYGGFSVKAEVTPVQG